MVGLRVSANMEPWISRVPAAGGKESGMESWEGQGHVCLCPHVGRENWGTGRQSPWWVRNDSSGFFGTTVGT